RGTVSVSGGQWRAPRPPLRSRHAPRERGCPSRGTRHGSSGQRRAPRSNAWAASECRRLRARACARARARGARPRRRPGRRSRSPTARARSRRPRAAGRRRRQRRPDGECLGSYRPCATLTRFGRLLRIAASRYAKGAVIRASRGALVGYRQKDNWRNLGRVLPPRSTRRDHAMYEANTERTELVSRESNGITVRLLWSRSTNLVTVTVADVANDEYF